MATPDPQRAKDLARIHLAAKELGLDEETYRELLRNLTGKTSAGALGPGERWKVMQEMKRMGATSAAPSYPGKPKAVPVDGAALMSKIEAHLADTGRPWAYAHAMAWRMFKRARIQDCEPGELHKIVAALEYDAKRNGRGK